MRLTLNTILVAEISAELGPEAHARHTRSRALFNGEILRRKLELGRRDKLDAAEAATVAAVAAESGQKPQWFRLCIRVALLAEQLGALAGRLSVDQMRALVRIRGVAHRRRLAARVIAEKLPASKVRVVLRAVLGPATTGRPPVPPRELGLARLDDALTALESEPPAAFTPSERQLLNELKRRFDALYGAVLASRS